MEFFTVIAVILAVMLPIIIFLHIGYLIAKRKESKRSKS